MNLAVIHLGFEREDLTVFSGLDIVADAGTVLHVAGANGVGKTTFLNILAGLMPPTSGNVSGELERFLYISHRTGVDPSLTPLENLSWFSSLEGCDTDPKVLADALNTVGLKSVAIRASKDLSEGQKRRIALARLFITKLKIWLLDEPFTALDAAGVQLIERRIEAHAKDGGIVLMSSHQIPQIANLKTLDLESFRPATRTGED